MSTVFGIHRLGKVIELEDDYLPYFSEDEMEDDFIKVAFRGNGNTIRFLNDLTPFLPENLKVYSLDNSAQGIYTIGDLIKESKLQ